MRSLEYVTGVEKDGEDGDDEDKAKAMVRLAKFRYKRISDLPDVRINFCFNKLKYHLSQMREVNFKWYDGFFLSIQNYRISMIHSRGSQSFAVVSRNFKFRSVYSSVRAIGWPNRQLRLSLSLAKSSNIMDIHEESSKVIGQGGDVEQTENILLNEDRIEKLSVQELRSELRSVGVSAKGRKADLVSALKGFLESSAKGESELVETNNQSSELKLNTPEKKSLKRNTRVVTSMKVSTKQCSKTSTEVVQSDDNMEEEETTVVSRKQKLSSKTTETSGKKASESKRRKTQVISSTVVEASVEASVSVTQSEPWTIFAHKRPQKGWKVYNPRTMRPPPLTGSTKSLKLLSWNVNGLRALLKFKSFSALQLAEREGFDVLCLQETKLQEKDVEAIKQTLLADYSNSFWTCSSSKLGYSGTAIISRIKPLSVRHGLGISDHDNEGRLVTVEFDSFYLLCAYVPNSGDGLKRLSYRVTEWDPSLSSYMQELEKSKPVILTGDLNCAHEEIDIYDPAGNKRSAGFTMEERESFETNFLSKGFVDTFREQHPGVLGYTYWGYRHNRRKTNKGWRLDYFLVSQSIASNVHDSYILPDITGSDHSPIGLVLKI